ncbi:MAG: DUF2807 domain-containing protein [Bacteroidales bacterium]|nr:DUF2807 domain-containing protein [Bacteroidales bacterium]
MKFISSFAVIMFFLLLSFGCSKSPGDCFTSTGKAITEQRSIANFTGILMLDNVDVELIKGNSPKVEVTAGEHIIDNIITEVIDSELQIKNLNNCNFVRSFDKPIKVKVYFQQIDSLEYRSIGNLVCQNPITTDTFRIDVYEGAGRLDFELNTAVSYLNFHYGTAELIVSGFSQVNYIYQASYGPLDARDLKTGFNYLENKSTNNCFVQAEVVLGVTISSIGNVYYWGNPQIDLNGSGSGQLLRGQ